MSTSHQDVQSPSEDAAPGAPHRTQRVPFNPSLVSMSSELSVIFDPLCFAAAAVAVVPLLTGTVAIGGGAFAPGNEAGAGAGMAAVLAGIMLYDPRFGALAAQGRIGALLRGYLLRLAVLWLVLMAIGVASGVMAGVPPRALLVWFAFSVATTALARVVATRVLQRLRGRGAFAEAVAVVGSGGPARRVLHALRQAPPGAIELLGVFDDRADIAREPAVHARALADLLALGQTRRIDWILLALPPEDELRLSAAVQRLKALSVPIALCPRDFGGGLPRHVGARAGEAVEMMAPAGHRSRLRETMSGAADALAPRWIVTLVQLVLAAPAAALRLGVARFRPRARPAAAPRILTFDNYDLAAFTSVAERYGQRGYGFVVTPNADHVIRLDEQASFRALYAAADYVLLDSRFLAKLLRLVGGPRLPVCTGSDLTANLLRDVILPDDPLVLIGCSTRQAQQLSERYGLRNLAHFNPPMGFIHDAAAVEACLRFVEAHSPFRFCLLAVGAPQQEVVAQLLKQRGRARGLALCIGASINFLTGQEQRAPMWMQRAGIEWAYRLAQDPRRLAHRYLVRGPRVFGVLRRADVVLRQRAPTLRLMPAPAEATMPLPATAAVARAEIGEQFA